MKKCILFTDIKGSSNLWKKHPKKMLKALRTHNSQIRSTCKRYQGFIIKTIGDAYMISFPDIYNGIDFAIQMSVLQTSRPIILGKEDKLQIRIGMCYGNVNQRRMIIQNKSLIDYFGSTVNIASRMESKVSQVRGFALCIQGKKKYDSKIIKYLNSENIKTKIGYYIDNLEDCGNILKRSKRLLNTNQIYEHTCKDANVLHGVGGDIITYDCELNI
jgi:hypothetical protein